MRDVIKVPKIPNGNFDRNMTDVIGYRIGFWEYGSYQNLGGGLEMKMEAKLKEYVANCVKQHLFDEHYPNKTIPFIPNKWESEDGKSGEDATEVIERWVKGEIWEDKHLLQIYGEWGVGKSTNVLMTAQRLWEQGIPVIYVDSEKIKLCEESFIKAIAKAIKDSICFEYWQEKVENIESFIRNKWFKRKDIVIIIDNAHLASSEVIEKVDTVVWQLEREEKAKFILVDRDKAKLFHSREWAIGIKLLPFDGGRSLDFFAKAGIPQEDTLIKADKRVGAFAEAVLLKWDKWLRKPAVLKEVVKGGYLASLLVEKDYLKAYEEVVSHLIGANAGVYQDVINKLLPELPKDIDEVIDEHYKFLVSEIEECSPKKITRWLKTYLPLTTETKVVSEYPYKEITYLKFTDEVNIALPYLFISKLYGYLSEVRYIKKYDPYRGVDYSVLDKILWKYLTKLTPQALDASLRIFESLDEELKEIFAELLTKKFDEYLEKDFLLFPPQSLDEPLKVFAGVFLLLKRTKKGEEVIRNANKELLERLINLTKAIGLF